MNDLPVLLALAWLIPLVSFTLIVLFGPKMGKNGSYAGHVATAAVLSCLLLSTISLGIWVNHRITVADGHSGNVTQEHLEHHDEGDPHVEKHDHDHSEEHSHKEDKHSESTTKSSSATTVLSELSEEHGEGEHGHDSHGGHGHRVAPEYIAGTYYTLAEFGDLRFEISYYIDAMTVTLFFMVALIASCIHFYSMGYMHDELHDWTDPEVTLSNGEKLNRPGRFHRFFQYLSLFCFSMFGILLAGNVFMIFIFWELVGACSFFLIGFYFERKSATTAANKAFIINRVGDFGMLIGLAALWGALGTLSFGSFDLEKTDKEGETVTVHQVGIFDQLRPADKHHALIVPEGFMETAPEEEEEHHEVKEASVSPDTSSQTASTTALADDHGEHGEAEASERTPREKYGYCLLCIAGFGIFCGCVGKSAQLPLMTWLPDAMEGPTPVSALLHSATMVAAGVYLAARFYPAFTPEVLVLIACIGCVTLFVAATIAITATNIKRVLAYSTVSQLGYMMFALGIGGWAAAVYHLITHAFFKSLLFMCSGSVIHACHTNEMTEMGGLRKKMPWTAYTMLVGCLAIAGAGLIYFDIGFSGFYSKDAIIAQAYSMWDHNGGVWWAGLLFFVPCAGAAITAFYMFRLWFLTFAGEPRDQHIYDHAHESPKVMYIPLVILAFFATTVAWSIPFTGIQPLANLIGQAEPAVGEQAASYFGLILPDEHLTHSHETGYHLIAGVIASATALLGVMLAVAFYGKRWANPADVRNQFPGIYQFLLEKWRLDELYDYLFKSPTIKMAACVSYIDQSIIDRFLQFLADSTVNMARGVDTKVDRPVIDGAVNCIGNTIYRTALSLRAMQTGQLRQYVMFIAVGLVALVVAVSIFKPYIT